MNQLDFPLITVLLLLPVAGSIMVALIPRDREDLVKGAAFATTLAVLALSLPLYFGFQTGAPGFQFEEVHAWIPGLNIDYHVGIDGISLFLVLLTALLSTIAVLSSSVVLPASRTSGSSLSSPIERL